jgi:aminopeptidase N
MQFGDGGDEILGVGRLAAPPPAIYNHPQQPMKLLALLALCTAWALADTYPRQTGVDAQHYTFRITLRDDTDEIAGEAMANLRILKDGLTQVSLDLAQPMTVTAVTSGGTAIPFTHDADRLTLTLPASARVGQICQFTVKYHGKPASGLYISNNSHGDRGFFSVNWPNLAHQWLPIIDHPYDKATSEFLVTAPVKYQVAANGLLQEERDLGDGWRLTHWKQSVPIASWLNAIAVAQFAHRNFGTAAGIPLQTWVPYQERDAGIAAFETPTRQAIEFYSAHIGPYPYEKLANVWASAPGFGGGTEHASVIFYGCCRSGAATVWHETAHQWFGDSVTEKDWDDVWLSEGFATYFTHLTAEHYDGRDAFLTRLKNDRTRVLAGEKSNPDATVVHQNLDDMRRVLAPSVIIYQKGGWVLHMLRGQVGTDRFWAAIRDYYQLYRDFNASSDDFRRVMEENSGQDLSWFFQQWLHRNASPAIEGGWRYDAGAKKIAIDLTQTQAGEAYRLPLEIGVTTQVSEQPRNEKIEMTQKTEHFELASDAPPAAVILDPNTWILMEAHFEKR